MGLGGAEMDKSLAEDIRAELEENRQYLVRALRAVETTTAECKEETREATLKAENALAQVRSLEDAVAKKDAQIAGIREAGEERIRALREQLQGQADQLEEQREQTEGLQQALEAQSLTLVDLREQVYVLQLRVLKSDEEADRATTVLNRAAEDKVAALVARVDKCEGELDNVQRKQQTFDSGLEDTLRAAEVKLQAQVSNSEALSALAFEEMETRLKAQMEEVSEAIVEANGSMRDWQEEVSSLDALLQALRQDWEASVQETKSEVEAMFKGEMRLTQRMNAMEGSIKGETSSRMAELEAALAQATYTLQVMTEEFHRKDNEFRAKLDLIAEIIDKQSDAQGRSAESLEEVVQQQRELLSKQQITDQGLVQVKNASNASPETAWQLAEMVRKIEAMENVLQSLESGISAPTMQNELNEQADRLKTVENRLDELQNGPPKETGKREDTSSQEIASQSDIGTLQTRVQTLEKQVEVLSTKPDHAPSRRETAEETQLKEQAASKKASKTTDEKALDDLKSGLKELKQEHMNLYGRVVSMERAKKALDGQARPSSDEPAADFDQWAIEGRVSRVIFVWKRISVSVPLCTCICVRTLACMYVHAYSCTCMRVYICAHGCVHRSSVKRQAWHPLAF
jgi:chromosome segregation ATPase